ncbi:MAG: multidrug effflux MFS transporter [Veillonella sp.]|nr:multidrug effflux MFS transporter [Veillonella sp.]
MSDLHKQETISKPSAFIVFFLGALTALTPLSIDMYLPALPQMPEVFNTSASNIQLTLSMTVVGIAIGQLLGGPISDVVGRKKPLIIGNILCAIATFACAWANSIEFLLAARFLAGFTGSLGVVVAKAVARDMASGKALIQLLSLLMMVNGLAPVLAPLVGGQVLVFASWRWVFILLGIFSVFLFALSLFFKETLPAESRHKDGFLSVFKNYGTLLKDKAFVGQCLIQGFAFGAFFAYISGSAFVYQNIFGLNAQWFSYIFGINSVGIVVAAAIGGRASNVVSEKGMLQFSLWQITLGSIAFLASMVFQMPFPIVAITLFITATSISNLGASSFSLALKDHGHMAGSASAILGFFSMIFGGIMAPIVGIQGEYTAIPMGITMVVCALIALLSFYGLIREK